MKEGHHMHGHKGGQKEFFNRLAEEWDSVTIHDKDKIRYIMSVLKLNGTERILDVGTGTGIMIPFYEEHLNTGSIHAIDFSENMILQCELKFPPKDHPLVTFEVADVYSIKDKDRYDVIVCYSCFPHFTDHQRAIDIFSGALKKNGKLLLAHSCSRDHINHVHRHGGHEISGDVLPDIIELGGMMEKGGLLTVFEQSDENYHIIMAVKE